MELLLTLILFGLAMLGMSIGVLLSGQSLRGSCGGVDIVAMDGDVLSCGSCPKKEVAMCPTDEPLVGIAQMGHLNPRKTHHH